MTDARVPEGGGSWTACPGAGPPQGILFVEAFGRLSRDVDAPGAPVGEGALWSVFLGRAEMMGWSSTHGDASRARETYWSVHEAELDRDCGSSRIGWAQVGLDAGVSPLPVLPAAIECLDDSLRRFGTTEVTGLQVTASHLQPGDGSFASDLLSWLSWFSTTAGSEAEALIATDARLFRGQTDVSLLDSLQRVGTEFFRFGPLVLLSGKEAIDIPPEAPTGDPLVPFDRGISVRLPEWSTAAAAWALAFVVATALAKAPDTSAFAVRLTRIH